RLLARDLKPDAVAIEVLPALLTHDGQRLFESHWNGATRLSFEEMTDLLPAFVRPTKNALRWGWSRALPVVRYSFSAYREYFAASDNYLIAMPEDIPTDGFGWRRGFAAHTWNAQRRETATQMLLRQYGEACADSRPGPGEPLLEVLLREIQAAGVPVVLYTM